MIDTMVRSTQCFVRPFMRMTNQKAVAMAIATTGANPWIAAFWVTMDFVLFRTQSTDSAVSTAAVPLAASID